MKSFVAVSLVAVVMLIAAAAFATTSNPSSSSPGYTPVILPVTGIYSSATGHAGIVRFKAPHPYRVLTVNLSARAVSGTNPTIKARISSGGFVNYSGTITAAGTPVDLTAATNNKIPDESTVVVDLIAGGTTPKWRDLTLFILLKRM